MAFVALMSLITATWMLYLFVDDIWRNALVYTDAKDKIASICMAAGFLSIIALAGRDLLNMLGH